MTPAENMDTAPTAQRAGRYAPQPGGYAAYLPAPLPPDPPVRIDTDMLGALSRADRALGRLDGATETLPNPDLFVFMYVRKEAVLSSQIEGTQASLLDVLEVEAQLKTDNPFDVEEVINYVGAMNYGLERLATLPVSLRLIREMHERLLAGVRGSQRNPGEFRRVQNHIGPPGCTVPQASFVPPPPTALDDTLAALERFIHADDELPVLIRVGLIHAQFETIHPFLDGNGRIGRLLITLLLCEREVLRRPLLYLSYYFKRNRTEYYDRLQRVRDRGDWEGWLLFFLRGVFEVAQEATDTARRIVRMRESDRNAIMQGFGRTAGNALRVHEHLYHQPIVTVQQVVDLLDISYSNANALVGQMQQAGLLAEITGQRRNRRFSFEPYLALFDDAESRAPAPAADTHNT
jgi:Fic family protein